MSKTHLINKEEEMRLQIWEQYSDGYPDLVHRAADKTSIIFNFIKCDPVDGNYDLAVIAKDNLCMRFLQVEFVKLLKKNKIIRKTT